MVLAIPIGIGAVLSLAYLLPAATRHCGWHGRRTTRGRAKRRVRSLGAAHPGTANVHGDRARHRCGLWAPCPASGPEIGIGILLAGLILFVMVLPTMTAISRDVLAAVPKEQTEGAFALGATHGQVLGRVIVPHARAGLLGAVTLAMGRALGETMAVAMVIGNTPAFAYSLFGTGDTMSSVIANEFTEATEPYHLASLIYRLLLLVVAAVVNVLARLLVRGVGRTRAAVAIT